MDKEKQIEEMANEIARKDCYLFDNCPKLSKHACISRYPTIMMECARNYITIATWLVKESYQKVDKDSVVISRKELEEKYEPSEKFMSVARELEDLKQNLEDKVVLSKEEYEKLLEQRRKARSEQKRFKKKYLVLKLKRENELEELRQEIITLSQELVNSRKEMAEKFVNLLTDNGERQTLNIEDNKGDICDKAYIIPQSHLRQLAKQFGFEMKE